MQVPVYAPAFGGLLPLLRHEAMESIEAPLVEEGLVSALQRSFVHSNVQDFIADARLLSRLNLTIRNGDVRLGTSHALTAGFRPPPAAEVSSSLGVALRYLDAALSRHRDDPAKAAICVLLGSQIVLTIHPFPDGNGRTARMYFAAKVLRHIGPAPTALLGLMLLYRGGAHMYHLASWELRAGNAEPMVELFANSVALANERFFPDGLTGHSPANFLAFSWRELQRLR